MHRFAVKYFLLGVIAFVIAFSGCAVKPLRTKEASPLSHYQPEKPVTVLLVGFHNAVDCDRLESRLTELFHSSEATVINYAKALEHGRTPFSASMDYSISLSDFFIHKHSNVNARRLTNFYFTFTILDIWIIPILQWTPLWRSDLTLQAYITIRENLENRVLWKGETSVTIREKPTGYLGPSEEEFIDMMMEVAGANLAAKIYDRFCESVY